MENSLKEISMLDSSKAIQATDIPVKVIKENCNFLQYKYALISMKLLVKENFHCLKLAIITLVFNLNFGKKTPKFI